jgi:LppP/LprE lipoprotein
VRRVLACLAGAGALALPSGGLGAPSDPMGPACAGTISLAAASRIVRSHGYVRTGPSGWRPCAKYNAIVGVAAGSADGYNERVFFFYGTRYLGTDAVAPSAAIRYAGRTAFAISIRYALYRPSDPLCCPHAGSKLVRFHWNGSRVVPLDAIPSANPRAPRHR